MTQEVPQADVYDVHIHSCKDIVSEYSQKK